MCGSQWKQKMILQDAMWFSNVGATLSPYQNNSIVFIQGILTQYDAFHLLHLSLLNLVLPLRLSNSFFCDSSLTGTYLDAMHTILLSSKVHSCNDLARLWALSWYIRSIWHWRGWIIDLLTLKAVCLGTNMPSDYWLELAWRHRKEDSYLSFIMHSWWWAAVCT